MFKMVVFSNMKSASDVIGTGMARPHAMLTRLSTGRLVEFRLDDPRVTVEITDEARANVPARGSALIFEETELEALEAYLSSHWSFEVYPLASTGPIDEE